MKKLNDLIGRRDIDALYFKPLCVYAVCELIDERRLDATKIDVAAVLDRFDELISPFIPGAAGEGYQPFWHLGTPGFWKPFSESGELVLGTMFASKDKPRSRKQLENAVRYVVPHPEVSARLNGGSERHSLMREVIDLLVSDDDISCQAVAGVLDERLNGLIAGKKNRPIAQEEDEFPEFTTEDYSKLRSHLRFERPNSKKVKAALGYVCQMCNVDLETVYGKVGRGYIEAHHLRPVAENSGSRVTLDIRKDFAVLCPNCHRMIHRAKLPHSIDGYVNVHGKPRLQN